MIIRAFVAVDLDADSRKVLARAQEQAKDRTVRELSRLAPEARIQWARPDSIHLTLKFLGEIADTRVEEIRHTLSVTIQAQPRFSVEVGGFGVFPDLRAPRVLWVGVSGQHDQLNSLARLAAEVDSGLDTLGFPREARPFSPHLTLARIKERSREVGQALTGSGLMTQRESLGSLRVDAVALIRSDLKPSGAVYTRLWEIPLKASAG
ncbi:MAG: RNA 2',3'-cyclic phosphodiesterase [Nitrospiraceae bacterium]